MCKFHKDVAREIATDPQTGKIDTTKYQIALVSLAKWWVQQYMPSLDVSGYSPYELATQQAQDAFKATHLPKSNSDIQSYKIENIPFLRHAINTVVDQERYSFNFSQAKLDKSMYDLYEGNPHKELTLVEQSPTREFDGLRQAIDNFLKIPEVEEKLRTMLEHNIAKLFQDAPQKTNGLILKYYEKHPSLRNAFNVCACSMGATGGFLASHAGCVISPSLTFITAASGAVGNAIAIGSSVAVTTIGLYLWHKIRGEVASKTERRLTFASAVLGASLAIGLHLGGAHHANHSDAEHLAEAKEWVQKFPPSHIDRMKETATFNNMTWDEYLSQEYEYACGKRDNKPQTPKP